MARYKSLEKQLMEFAFYHWKQMTEKEFADFKKGAAIIEKANKENW